MRIVNEKFDTITDYDPEKGRLLPAVAIREDAQPIDNVSKWAWSEKDYEPVMMYVQEPESEHVPSAQEDTDAMMVDHEYRMTLLELGLAE